MKSYGVTIQYSFEYIAFEYIAFEYIHIDICAE